MPVVEDETGEVVYRPKVVEPWQTVAPTPTTSPTGAPAAPTVTPQPGLRGRARFESDVNKRSFNGGYWGEDFNRWVISLPDDPLDPEYNQVLKWAKAQAKQRLDEATRLRTAKEQAEAERQEFARGHSGFRGGAKDDSDPTRPNAGQFPKAGRPGSKEASGKGGSEEARGMVKRETFEVPHGAVFPGQLTGPKTQSEQDRELAQLEAEKASGKKFTARQAERAEWSKPVFKGRPIKEGEVLEPATTGDADLDKFLSDNGVVLDPGQAAKAKLSGGYVYMGQEHNDTLNTSRSTYMYVDEAKAAGADPKVLPRELLSEYQKALGEPVTGYLEGDLAKMWDEAVDDAIRYTQAGHDVTPRELFDMRVKQKISGGGRGGGGGGGGAQRLEAFDYYRSMMQILGDISGVGEA